jgi:hypothetical protein
VKFITACVLVTISFLVFLVVYKFSTTWGLLLLDPPENVNADESNSSYVEATTQTSQILHALYRNSATNETSSNSSAIPFDFHYYQRALLRRKPALVEGFRRIFNVTDADQKP